MMLTAHILAAGLAAMAAGDAPSPPPQRGAFRASVSIQGLDLNTAEGRAALQQRMRAAANAACTPRKWPAQYEPKSVRACRDQFERAAEKYVGQRAGNIVSRP